MCVRKTRKKNVEGKKTIKEGTKLQIKRRASSLVAQ